MQEVELLHGPGETAKFDFFSLTKRSSDPTLDLFLDLSLLTSIGEICYLMCIETQMYHFSAHRRL